AAAERGAPDLDVVDAAAFLHERGIVRWREAAVEPVIPPVPAGADEADGEEGASRGDCDKREPARVDPPQASPYAHRPRSTPRSVKGWLSNGEDRYRRSGAESCPRVPSRRRRFRRECRCGPTAKRIPTSRARSRLAGGERTVAPRHLFADWLLVDE